MALIVVDTIQLQRQWEGQWDLDAISSDLTINEEWKCFQLLIHIHFQFGIADVLAQIQLVELALTYNALT